MQQDNGMIVLYNVAYCITMHRVGVSHIYHFTLTVMHKMPDNIQDSFLTYTGNDYGHQTSTHLQSLEFSTQVGKGTGRASQC